MYLAWYRTGQIWEQVPDKFRTSSGQVLDKFGQVLFWNLSVNMTGLFNFMRRNSCVFILVQNRTNLGASSRQVPDKFRTSSGQALFTNLSASCPKIKLSASCPRLHKNSWVLYWTSSSCPMNKLVSKLSGVVHRWTTTSVKMHWHMIRHWQFELHFFLIPHQIKNVCALHPVITCRVRPN